MCLRKRPHETDATAGAKDAFTGMQPPPVLRLGSGSEVTGRGLPAAPRAVRQCARSPLTRPHHQDAGTALATVPAPNPHPSSCFPVQELALVLQTPWVPSSRSASLQGRALTPSPGANRCAPPRSCRPPQPRRRNAAGPSARQRAQSSRGASQLPWCFATRVNLTWQRLYPLRRAGPSEPAWHVNALTKYSLHQLAKTPKGES